MGRTKITARPPPRPADKSVPKRVPRPRPRGRDGSPERPPSLLPGPPPALVLHDWRRPTWGTSARGIQTFPCPHSRTNYAQVLVEMLPLTGWLVDVTCTNGAVALEALVQELCAHVTLVFQMLRGDAIHKRWFELLRDLPLDEVCTPDWKTTTAPTQSDAPALVARALVQATGRSLDVLAKYQRNMARGCWSPTSAVQTFREQKDADKYQTLLKKVSLVNIPMENVFRAQPPGELPPTTFLFDTCGPCDAHYAEALLESHGVEADQWMVVGDGVCTDKVFGVVPKTGVVRQQPNARIVVTVWVHEAGVPLVRREPPPPPPADQQLPE